MTAQRSIVVLGSINVDRAARVVRLPAPGETITGACLPLAAGGKSANQAVAAARLGARVRLLGAVGDDPEGRWVVDAIADHGVDTTAVAVEIGTPTGQAIVLVDDAGENCIVVLPGANARVATTRLDEKVLTDAGVLLLCLEVADDVVLDAARRARAVGVPVVLNLSPARPIPRELLPLVDVLVVNEHELASLLGQDGNWASRPDHALNACGVDTVVVTLGGDGATTLRRGRPPLHQAAPTVPVVDTTGCGDAFLGALASQLAAGLSVSEAVPLAVTVGSYAATKVGAQGSYPTHADLAARTEPNPTQPRSPITHGQAHAP